MVWYIPYNGDIMVIYRGEEWYWYWYDIDRNATQKIDIWSDIISDFLKWSDLIFISEKMWYLTPLTSDAFQITCHVVWERVGSKVVPEMAPTVTKL